MSWPFNDVFDVPYTLLNFEGVCCCGNTSPKERYRSTPSVCVVSRGGMCLLPPTTPPSDCVSHSENSIWHSVVKNSVSRPRSYLDCCQSVTAGSRVLSKGRCMYVCMYVRGVVDSVALNTFSSSTLFLRQLSFHSTESRVQLTATQSVCMSVLCHESTSMEIFTLCVHA